MSDATSEASFTVGINSIDHGFIADDVGPFQTETPKASRSLGPEARIDLGTIRRGIRMSFSQESRYLSDSQARGDVSANIRTQSEVSAHSSTCSNMLMK